MKRLLLALAAMVVLGTIAAEAQSRNCTTTCYGSGSTRTCNTYCY